MSRKINEMMGKRAFRRCFHIHRISCMHLPPAEESVIIIKLIKWDGVVKIYDRPIKAWEIMEEFPKHMVCRSDCFYFGQKTPTLSHHDRLLPGHNYFLLPANFFQSALSFASFFRCRTTFSGFEFEKTPSGSLRIKVTEEMIFRLQQDQDQDQEERVCTTPQLRKDYEQLVGRRHHWKPKLDTIFEKKKGRKKKMMMMKKKKKKKKKKSGLE